MKKKLIPLIMASVCAISCTSVLVACGDSDPSGSQPDSATVTQAEWTAAFSELKFENLTSTQWCYTDKVTDINDLETNKNNINYKSTLRTAKVDNTSWIAFDYETPDTPEYDSKSMVKVLADGGVEYMFNPDTSKWFKDRDRTEAGLDSAIEKWKRSYKYNLLSEQADRYENYTYVKSEKLYRYTRDDEYTYQVYELKFQDKKLASFTQKTSIDVYEMSDFGTTTVEVPTQFECANPIGQTFYLADVEAHDAYGDETTDATVLAAAAEIKTNNLHKTTICKVQSMGGGIDGVVKGTCNFGLGAFDDLTGDNIFYWGYVADGDYFGDLTVKTMDNGISLSGKYAHEVLTLKYPVGENGYYLSLIFRFGSAPAIN